jgi:phosphonopyruvate decarboxylase
MSKTLPTLTLGGAMAALIEARATHQPKAVFVATMSAQFALDTLGETARRIDSVPLMGGASGIGLGIALARPDVPVVVIDGDSSLLMELGSLATVANNRPRRYLHIVVDNRVQFNGLRNLPAPSAEAGLDFAAMARGAGYDHAQRIDTHADWVAALPQLLARTGTSFVELGVRPDAPLIGAQRPQPILPDLQFVRMRMGVRKLATELMGGQR